MANIVIIGGSISGLSSAVAILENIPGVQITVIAEKFSPDTTADIAAGVCIPFLMADTPPSLLMEWFTMTLEHLLKLYHSEKSYDFGISFLSGFMIFSQYQDFPSWKNAVLGFREITEEEKTNLFPNLKIVTGWFFSTYTCQCEKYLPYLMSRFLSAGGIIKQKKVMNLEELADSYDIIINCCGVQSQYIANDVTVYPSRGHAIQVSAPWINHFYMYDLMTYIVPLQNKVILGGTNQKDDYNLTPNKEDHDAILEKCQKVIPTLKNSQVLKDTVGLRPIRRIVRIEKGSPIKGRIKSAQVVHNYGHGGSGITVHWGCAQKVSEIVSRIVQASKL